MQTKSASAPVNVSIVVVLRVESAAAVEEMSTTVIAKSFVMLGARCPRSAGLTVRESIARSWDSCGGIRMRGQCHKHPNDYRFAAMSLLEA